MRAPMGIGLILFGAVMGYLVITGKLPATTAPTPPGPTTPYVPVNPPTGSTGGVGGAHASGGPFGLPTMNHLADVGASTGGM